MLQLLQQLYGLKHIANSGGIFALRITLQKIFCPGDGFSGKSTVQYLPEGVIFGLQLLFMLLQLAVLMLQLFAQLKCLLGDFGYGRIILLQLLQYVIAFGA